MFPGAPASDSSRDNQPRVPSNTTIGTVSTNDDDGTQRVETQISMKEKEENKTEHQNRRKEKYEKRIAKLVDKLGMSEENAKSTVAEIEKQMSTPQQKQEYESSFSFTQKADLGVFFLLFSALMYVSIQDYRGGVQGITRNLVRMFPREAQTLGLTV